MWSEFFKNRRAQRLRVHGGFMNKQSDKTVVWNLVHRNTTKTANVPISIEKWTTWSQRHSNYHGFVRTGVRKHCMRYVLFFQPFGATGRFGVPLWRPLDEKKRSKKRQVWKKDDLFMGFSYKYGRPDMEKNNVSHYTCCKLGELGGQENWSKKRHQRSSRWNTNSSPGHSKVWF